MITPVEIASDVQTIIWDFDGTLLDSFGIYWECLNVVLKEHGRPEIREEILRGNHYGHIEESIAGALKDAGQKVSGAELAEIIQAFYALDNVYIKEGNRHLFLDANDLAKRAHKAGKRQIVVTNRPHGVDRGSGSPRNLIANSRLRYLIEDVICGDDSAFHKPDRRVLETVFGSDLAGIGKAVVVGDQFVDADFARRCGFTAILVVRADRIAHLDRLPDWKEYMQIVPSLFDVKV